MWIRIEYIRHVLLKVKKKNYCKILSVPTTFLGSDLKKYNFLRKKPPKFVKLCFSIHFIPLDPDPPDQRTQMNPDLHHWVKGQLDES